MPDLQILSTGGSHRGGLIVVTSVDGKVRASARAASRCATYWMWLRPMPAEVATDAVPAGSLILVDFKTAVRMQKSWEAWTADLAAPDEEGT